MQRFIGKKVNRKIVRPICNANKPHKVTLATDNNKEIKETKEDMGDIKIDKVNDVLEAPKAAPKRKVKVEKKDKGLYERTENSTIYLTEDNKMLLND